MHARELREQKVYEALCQIIPGLQNRLLEAGSDENILHIADLVSLNSSVFTGIVLVYNTLACRYRRELTVHEPMTPRVLKVLSSTGSRLAASLLTPLWHVMSRPIGASIMSGLGHCFVLPVLTGLMPSKSSATVLFQENLNFTGSKKSCRVAKWQSLATNGHFSCIIAITMTPTIRGMASLGVPSLSL